MASNPFDSFVGFNPFDNVSSANPFDTFGAAPDRGGIVGIGQSLVRETVADVVGAGRVVGAALGTPFDLIGLNVPVRWEDLTARDYRGAAMVAAMAVGGLASRAVAGLPAGAILGNTATWAGRAQRTAVVEAGTGALFGSLRPLDEGEGRMHAVLGEGALFGAFGAGASMAKSAVGATLLQYRAHVRNADALLSTAEAARSLEGERAAREMLGLRLRNGENGGSVGLRRDLNSGRIIATYYDSPKLPRSTHGKIARTQEYTDFGQAASEAMQAGYTERVGLFRSRHLKGAEISDARTLELLSQGDEGIAQLVQGFQLNEYTAVRKLSGAAAERDASLAALEAEALTEHVGVLGAVEMAATTKASVARAAGLKGWHEMSDAEVLREGVLKGIVSVDNLEQGANARAWLKELFYNDLMPSGSVYTVGNTRDAFFTRFLTPRMVARTNPEVLPLFQSADNRLIAEAAGHEQAEQFLWDLSQKVSREKANIGARIIDESQAAGDVAAAQAAATSAARATGDAEVIAFVESATAKLGEYLGRLQQAGRLESGLPGYFPIANVGKWKLDVDGAFFGAYGSKEEARSAFQRVLAEQPNARATIAPHGFTFEEGSLTLFEPKQWKALIKAITEAGEETLSAAEVREIATHAGLPVKAAVGLKHNGNLQARKLGTRDFSEDAFDALRIYMRNMERTLAFNDFEREATALIAGIDPNKRNLTRWAQQYTQDMLGRPRDSEILFDNAVAALGLDLKPRALKRASRAARWFQSNMRLGGPMSGLVNSTQFAINAYPVLGERYAARGLAAILNPKEFQRVVRTFKDNGHDLGAFVPLTAEGGIGFDSIQSHWKRKEFGEVASRVWLSAFNGAEKFNRVATAAGALAREVDAGVPLPMAVERAMAVVERTQFNYRMSNVPEILRGPIGGVLGQFKSYFINEVEFMASLSKAEAARFALAAQVVGGLAIFTNMPGIDVLNFATGLFFDRNLEETLKTAPGENPLARFTVFGVPSLLGVDASDYVGLGSIADVTRGIFGPTVGDLGTLTAFARDAVADIGAYGNVSHETMNAFMQRAMPSALRRAQRGLDILSTGEVRNAYSHKLIYKSDQRAREAFLTGVGFPLIDVQQERAMDQVTTRVRERYIRARSGYAKEAAIAALRGDRRAMQAALAEARAAGISINDDSLRYYIREMRKPAEERRRRRTPIDVRRQMRDAYEATGAVRLEEL